MRVMVTPYDWFVAHPDETSREFLRVIALDSGGDLDRCLSRLLELFAVPMPETTGSWAHHDGR